MENKNRAFEDLMQVVYELREKCPWDRKQTWDSLRPMTIEEMYELTDAILEKDYEEAKKELGDVMLHVLFYAMIAEEEKRFNIGDVMNSLREKLISRHPHIYGEVKADTPDEVKKNWEEIKLKEGNKTTLSGVPKSLSSVVKAARLQEKASSVGFDWNNIDEVWDKVREEMDEFYHEAQQTKDQDKLEAEFGDLLFSLVNYARFLNIDPDNALERTNKKFIRRFNYLESEVTKKGLKLKDMSLEEMDAYWDEAKAAEREKTKNQ